MDDFAALLIAEEPAAGVPDLFGRLIGSWRVNNRSLDEASGVWSEAEFTWTFVRTLDGLGVQDLIVLADGSIAGTSVRAWDADAEVWRVSWFGVRGRNFGSFVARPEGADGIRLEGSGQDGRALLWQFSDIQADGFSWDGQVETSAGWLHEQDMDAVRQSGPTVATAAPATD
ncbi:MAG: hypothetical protein ABI435_03230 [Pseudolysinimonas sp.]